MSEVQDTIQLTDNLIKYKEENYIKTKDSESYKKIKSQKLLNIVKKQI